jgi:hypothetical protein
MVTPSFSVSEVNALREAATTRATIGVHLTLTAPFHPLTDLSPLRGRAFRTGPNSGRSNSGQRQLVFYNMPRMH